jgi:hypothetical protein
MRMPKRGIIALVLTFLAALPTQAAFDPFAGPKPIAVFIEQNPWLMVIGSDTPRVTIYENGDVIFLKKLGDKYSMQIAKLPQSELAQLEQKWLPLFEVKLKRDYSLSDATDQTSAQLYLRKGDETIAVEAYGLDCDGISYASTLDPAETPPTEFYAVHKTLCNLDLPSSDTWVPNYVEVMLWDYDYAPDKSIHWPQNWPNFESERAIQRGDMWSIFLDGTEQPKLSTFLKTRPEKGAVEVGGKKWAASVRYTYPSEPVWRRALWARPDKE